MELLSTPLDGWILPMSTAHDTRDITFESPFEESQAAATVEPCLPKCSGSPGSGEQIAAGHLQGRAYKTVENIGRPNLRVARDLHHRCVFAPLHAFHDLSDRFHRYPRLERWRRRAAPAQRLRWCNYRRVLRLLGLDTATKTNCERPPTSGGGCPARGDGRRCRFSSGYVLVGLEWSVRKRALDCSLHRRSDSFLRHRRPLRCLLDLSQRVVPHVRRVSSGRKPNRQIRRGRRGTSLYSADVRQTHGRRRRIFDCRNRGAAHANPFCFQKVRREYSNEVKVRSYAFS